MSFDNIAVFCASSEHVHPQYFEVASAVGRFCGEKGARVVYGGAQNGLMGAVADAALDVGGEVVGVMPEMLIARERAHKGLTQLYKTQNMHERQQKMADLSDVFLILPGGLGTLAEFFEVVTWKHIGLHDKPILILNSYGYWNHLKSVIEQGIEENFIGQNTAEMITWLDNIEDLESFFKVYTP